MRRTFPHFFWVLVPDGSSLLMIRDEATAVFLTFFFYFGNRIRVLFLQTERFDHSTYLWRQSHG